MTDTNQAGIPYILAEESSLMLPTLAVYLESLSLYSWHQLPGESPENPPNIDIG